MSTEHIIDAELVDEPTRGSSGLVVPRSSTEHLLSPAAQRMIAAAQSPNSMRARARQLFGRAVKPGPDRTVVDSGPARAPWDTMAWVLWCERHGHRSGMDGPATAAVYANWAGALTEWVGEDGRRIGAPTIAQALAAVRWLHDQNGYDGHPPGKLASGVLAGYRLLGAAEDVDQATPLTVPLVRRFVTRVDELRPHTPLLNQRDKILLLLGVPGMLRRSELTALQQRHVRITDRGLRLYVASSKTDKTAQGASVVLPIGQHPETCPRTQYRLWLEMLGEHDLVGDDRPVLCSIKVYGQGRTERPGGNPLDGRDVDRAIKVIAAVGDFGPGSWSGHSPRAGGATSAYLGGADIRSIMQQGRWVKVETVMRYIREIEQWTHNAATKMDL